MTKPANSEGIRGTPVTTANVVADYLLFESRARGEALTNLKLQKLLYYAQAWYLALHDRPLFNDDFEAWVHGPVLRSQYFRFKPEPGWAPITDSVDEPEISFKIKKFLDQILDVFGSESAIALEMMTHRERPWLEARAGLAPDHPSTARISRETMRDFYRSMQAK